MLLDRGIWINWYDLPDDGRETYLSWLHDTYIPKVLARSGVLWAAHYASENKNTVVLSGAKDRLKHVESGVIPAGDRFILLFGAEEAPVFAAPTPAAFHAGLPEKDKKMLAMRSGERATIMTEESRVLGPAARKPAPELELSPGIQLGSFNAGSYEDEDELAAWYAQWRMPCMEKLPGCVRVRKLVSVSGWGKHGILYEFTSVAARNEHFIHHEGSNPEMEAWTDRVVRKLVHAPGSPYLAHRIWPPIKN